MFQILWDTSLEEETNSRLYSEVSTLEAWFSLAQGPAGVESASQRCSVPERCKGLSQGESGGFRAQIPSQPVRNIK